ncbi:MAG: crossover junction endodeoxyribonuclease RuvC, partial [Actinomycetota bacterium]
MFVSGTGPVADPLAPRSASPKRVLGIDPGMTRCGYAVLESTGANSVSPVSLGVLRTSATDSTASRLAQLHLDIEELISEFEPDAVAVEQVFFQVNVRTAMSVGQVSGIAMALAVRHGCQVVEYTPNQVKESVTGWGGADKAQVQKMVQARLGLTRPPEPVDAADAAAVALCFLATEPLQSRLIESGAKVVHGRV